jgi:thioesterase DpgC
MIPPKLNSNLDIDANTLDEYVKKANRLLARIPARYKCTSQEKQLKDEIVSACQTIRCQFIHRHCAAVYSILTHDFRDYHRLEELVFLAAEQFPGLVPTRSDLHVEQKLIQAHKEGLEIDQGIFFNGLLKDPKIGKHLLDAMLLPCARALSLQHQMQHQDTIDLGTVLYERHAHSAFITINNPNCLNAENNLFVADMETAVDLALLDERVQVCLLRGGIMTHPRYAGKRVFCSGINLKDLSGGNISYVNFLLTRELGYISKIVHGLLLKPLHPIASLATIQKPWIGVVDSFAIGGGMQLLLVCDKVIAADDSYFSLPAAQEGIIPGVANYRLTRMSNNRLARQIILSGQKILASSSEAHYFCDEVVSNKDLDASIATTINYFSKPAVTANRRMLNLAEEPRESFLEYMAEFAYVQAKRLYSDDVLAKVGRFTLAREKFSCS